MQAIIAKLKKELELMRNEDREKMVDAETRHESFKRTNEKELETIRQRLDYVTKEFYGYKNKNQPQTTNLENKVRNLDGKVGELKHHNETNQKRLDDLQPILEVRNANEDLRQSLCNFIFDAWNKQYEEVFQKKNEYMRNFDMQEQRNKTYTNDIRELH